MAGGRPTKYKPEYCEKLIAHMSEGLSFESFAAQCDSDRDTLYQWTHTHKEFSDAKKKATAKSLEYWEKMGRAGIAGKLKGFNVAGWIYSMKCRFREDWGEKQEVSHLIEDRREIKAITDSDLDRLLIEAKDAKKP